MLAQNLKTPAALGISDVEFESLVKVMGMLERGEIQATSFNMGTTGALNVMHEPDCKSPACICGWARTVARKRIFLDMDKYSVQVRNLFMMGATNHFPLLDYGRRNDPARAAIALRNYLTTGKPRWAEALAD